MDEEKLDRLEKFIRRLPEPERKRAILVMGGRTLSWMDVLEELKTNGDLSSEIEKKLMDKSK